MYYKSIWLENLVAFNKAVQKSGGVMEIKSSFTDFEGNVNCYVGYNKQLTTDAEIEYEKDRVIKK